MSTMTSFGSQQQQLTQADLQQLWNTSQETFEEMRQKITEAAKAVVRYSQLARPAANPAELLLIADQAIQTTALAIVNRVEPTSGRIRPRQFNQQRRQPQLVLPTYAPSQSQQGGQDGLSKAQRRQIEQLTRQTILQLTQQGQGVGNSS
jgi:hypothetical protein